MVAALSFTTRVAEQLSSIPPVPEFCPHEPTPHQWAYLSLPHIEALFGGAAGGGKSDALLMGALQYVDVPSYRALLLRKTYRDLALPGALMDRAFQWFTGTGARWHAGDVRWEFPSGAEIVFGHLDTENHKFRYQSSEFQYVGFDELSQFTETQYRYLFSRLRRLAGSRVPIRMRAATNPGGVGHSWVYNRFVNPKTRVAPFIPAKLSDNPYLDAADYRDALSRVDPVQAGYLLRGDWRVRSTSGLFKREWIINPTAGRPLMKVDELATLRFSRVVRFWDLASTEVKSGADPDWTVGTKIGISSAQDGLCVVLDMRELRDSPAKVQALISSTAATDGPNCKIVIEEEPGASGKALIDHYSRSVLRGYSFQGERATGDKVTRFGPFSSACERGLVRVLEGPWLGRWCDELESFPEGSHDDHADSASGAFNFLHKPGQAIGSIPVRGG